MSRNPIQIIRYLSLKAGPKILTFDKYEIHIVI